ncbi:hypothetical protein J3Q64DRAFT_1763743 [Phycomyces blakesleeanus]|uniref:Uncharacterized protein n=2 Tax=Phycomyces blakesleeanus TaxID=4837 RepID=A0A163D3C8_PHYB8|nr:hypothetical protein PHYBLDRAFT_188746 [Phycomyces blakesleeanus NRRL 1555(-)]OAD68420.1 hypothetical protein PHYBLDRAFT_188746 [Phycomyces blakesleeanus NRRL 1555(-)]|eukprot:XP_018286460.1 hypothetical protein PHYBLDRAFT_188746 [Phycomyces blakesleeanus NRRL 1555(-)]
MIAYLLLALIALVCRVAAQVGPTITFPHENGTIVAGETVEIKYDYPNMGTGNYSVDIALWADASATQNLLNITTNEVIPSGNSTGFTLAFNLTSTYKWKVPNGLNETVYLTVTEYAKTSFFFPEQRSAPMMLHVSAAFAFLPFPAVSLFFVSMVILYFGNL